MASISPFATTNESFTSLEYNCSNLSVKITVIYDTEVPMQVDSETEEQPEHKFHLIINGTGFHIESSFDYRQIEDYVPGIKGFLGDYVDTPAGIMKTVRCISFYLKNMVSNVIHMVPGTERLQIRKVEHGKLPKYYYSSNPTLDIMYNVKVDQINRFFRYSPTLPGVFTLLWQLSERVVS